MLPPVRGDLNDQHVKMPHHCCLTGLPSLAHPYAWIFQTLSSCRSSISPHCTSHAVICEPLLSTRSLSLLSTDLSAVWEIPNVGVELFLCLSSVHMKIEEKISLTCGRDGGLQNMELHGMIMLHISDEKFARIRLHVENEDKRGVQLQVKPVWSPMLLNMLLLLSREKVLEILKYVAVLCSCPSLLSKCIGNGSVQV